MPEQKTGGPGQGAVADDAAHLRELRLQRNLKILVVGLGVLIFLGLGAVVWKMLQLGRERRASATAAGVISAAPSGDSTDVGLELPKGARVVSTSVSDNRLAVHYESPSGTGIAVLDLATGRRILDVKPMEGVPRQ